MAHFQKFKLTDCKKVMKEAYREIDSKSEHYKKDESINNLYWKDYKEVSENLDRIIKDYKPPRKDIVILINEVITAPKDLKEEDINRFFIEVGNYTKEKLGADGTAYFVIHKDEYAPHAHISYYALKDGKWSSKYMLNKEFLRDYHKDLNKHMKEYLGYSVEIVKDKEEPHLTYSEYKAKKKNEKIEEKEKLYN